MLINLSNHHSGKWSNSQMESAVRLYGLVRDIPFPDIDPKGTEEDIVNLANELSEIILHIFSEHTGENNSVHIMGELTFCFAIITILISNNIKCVASTTNRIANNNSDGSKTIKFDFVKFREYSRIMITFSAGKETENIPKILPK